MQAPVRTQRLHDLLNSNYKASRVSRNIKGQKQFETPARAVRLLLTSPLIRDTKKKSSARLKHILSA